MPSFTPPDYDCPLCPRLVNFHLANRKAYPDFYNGPVPSFGDLGVELLVVGLAPGLKGANRTGRPFTGDYAGIVLYSALKKHGFAEGEYDPEKVASCRSQVAGNKVSARVRGEVLYDDPAGKVSRSETGGNVPPIKNKTDNFKLINCRITNAVRCVPPGNKPEPSEIRRCNQFLAEEIKAVERLKVIVSLGQIAHKAIIQALGLRQSQYAFAHGAHHHLPLATHHLSLINSYHSSRYNINTGALTQSMFDDVIATAKGIMAGNSE